jgi:hypothetical protein
MLKNSWRRRSNEKEQIRKDKNGTESSKLFRVFHLGILQNEEGIIKVMIRKDTIGTQRNGML